MEGNENERRKDGGLGGKERRGGHLHLSLAGSMDFMDFMEVEGRAGDGKQLKELGRGTGKGERKDNIIPWIIEIERDVGRRGCWAIWGDGGVKAPEMGSLFV
jgi:hypothetical protein